MCIQSCKNLKTFLQIETQLINEHIDKHKWCNHIIGDEEAIVDFVGKFAWLIREIYCGSICEHRSDCCAAKDIIDKYKFIPSRHEWEKYLEFSYGGEDQDLIELKIKTIHFNIETHKWLNKIGKYEEAVQDFLNKFGWVIFALYQKDKEGQI
jgi:hypothetical protein